MDHIEKIQLNKAENPYDYFGHYRVKNKYDLGDWKGGRRLGKIEQVMIAHAGGQRDLHPLGLSLENAIKIAEELDMYLVKSFRSFEANEYTARFGWVIEDQPGLQKILQEEKEKCNLRRKWIKNLEEHNNFLSQLLSPQNDSNSLSLISQKLKILKAQYPELEELESTEEIDQKLRDLQQSIEEDILFYKWETKLYPKEIEEEIDRNGYNNIKEIIEKAIEEKQNISRRRNIAIKQKESIKMVINLIKHLRDSFQTDLRGIGIDPNTGKLTKNMAKAEPLVFLRKGSVLIAGELRKDYVIAFVRKINEDRNSDSNHDHGSNYSDEAVFIVEFGHFASGTPKLPGGTREAKHYLKVFDEKTDVGLIVVEDELFEETENKFCLLNGTIKLYSSERSKNDRRDIKEDLQQRINIYMAEVDRTNATDEINQLSDETAKAFTLNLRSIADRCKGLSWISLLSIKWAIAQEAFEQGHIPEPPPPLGGWINKKTQKAWNEYLYRSNSIDTLARFINEKYLGVSIR